MRVNNFIPPRSSFLSMEKDISIIIDKILKNERLKRLLFYTTKDALYQNNLTEEQSISLIDNNIKIIPKLQIDKDSLVYIIISFDNFVSSKNPQFRDNIISFDIICHYDLWKLNNFQLRPYKIAGEIDSMFDNQKFSGIGVLNFISASQIIINEEFGGISLSYVATHGGEDKIHIPTPEDEEQFLKDFNDYIKADG